MDNLLQGITWLGHDSFKIKAPEGVIYIDPWKLKGGESRRGGTEYQPADVILITHGHHDHFSPDDVKKIQKADTIIVSVADVTAQVKGNVKTVKPGDTLTVKGVQIEAVPAYNPAKQFHPKAAGHVGYIVTVGGRRIYHAGDTDVIPEMANIKTDVALLPVGGKYTMTASEAAQAANLIKPKVAVPMHWGDIIGSRADAEDFRAQAKVPVQILEPE
jgi:L-ascorbate metabolism protein UlaG (beta-lactamase superfamily)